MRLEDLFVSHKQVSPVSFTEEIPELPNTIYLNLERAQKATQQEQVQQESDEDASLWKIGGYDGNYHNWKVKKSKPTHNAESKKDGQVVNDDSKVAYNENKGSQTESKLLKSYRNNLDYKSFKKELDTFIANNPQYSNIKNNLDYLTLLIR